MKMDVLSLEGKKVGDIELSPAVFATEVRTDLMHRAVLWQEAAQRQGSANTKGRAEIARTGAKWFRQKGTGRARHGSRRSNIFVGGGITFGPKPRSFAIDLPKKVRNLALRSALSAKAAGKTLAIVDEAVSKSHKTKDLNVQFSKLGFTKALFIVDNMDENFSKASRNLPFVKVIPTQALNVRDILAAETVVLTKNAACLRARG